MPMSSLPALLLVAIIFVLSCYASAQTQSTLLATSSTAGLSAPYQLCVDTSNNVYVTSTGNNRVLKISPAGALLQTYSLPGLVGVNGVAVDTAGNVYISNTTSPAGSVIKFNNAGAYQQTFALPTNMTGLQYPWGVAVDSSNNVFVADTVGEQVVKFSPAGAVLLQIPQPAASYPNQIALDNSGNV